MTIDAPIRVLMTGASGFVGRHLLSILAAQDFEVHAVARSIPEDLSAGDIAIRDMPGRSVNWHCADLLAPGVARALSGAIAPTHLVHLAWNVVPGKFWTAPDNLDWVAASLDLYRGFAEAGGRRALFAGTCAEYDWQYSLLDETTTPCRPQTLYGVAKHALHLLLAAAAASDGVSFAWARLFFMYGPHEPATRLIPYVITSILQEQPALCGDGEAERDFMYVADVAGALAATLHSGHVGPVNIASGTCVKLRDIIETAAECLSRPDLLRLGARTSPPGEPLRLAAATKCLNETIGFSPVTDLRDGLASTIDWWRQQSALNRRV